VAFTFAVFLLKAPGAVHVRFVRRKALTLAVRVKVVRGTYRRCQKYKG
jgi:hypothetical protein